MIDIKFIGDCEELLYDVRPEAIPAIDDLISLNNEIYLVNEKLITFTNKSPFLVFKIKRVIT
jgi:hypothetical protein